jgi:DNA-binding beta-propeller fold protein YncE
VDGTRLELLWETPTGSHPQTLALDPDGNIWVANKGSATLTVLTPAGTSAGVIALAYGSAPHGLVFSPDGQEAYAALEGAGKLIKVDPAARRVTTELALGPTPRGLAVSPDGKRILITRFVSPTDHAELWEVDAAAFAKVRTFDLAEDLSPDDETGGAGVLNYLQSVVISPTGREAVIPAKKDNIRRGLARNGLPLIFENTVRTVSTRLNLLSNAEDPALRNDIDNASLATAAAFSPLGDLFFIALQGINAVHVLDPYNNGAVLERIADVGLAPRGLAVDGKAGRLFVHNFLGRSVAVFDIASVLANTRYESKPVKTVATVLREALSPEGLRKCGLRW